MRDPLNDLRHFAYISHMRVHHKLVKILTLLLCFQVVIDVYAQRSLVRTYTVGDGLVMNRVRGFHQDKEGFIWMYTWDGLSRYEGYRFRNYIAGRDLQHSFVNDIFELPDGTLYLPLNDGSMAVMRNQRIESEIVLPGDVINCFYSEDHETIYAGTDYSGICLLDNGKLVPLWLSLPVTSIQQVIRLNAHFFFIGPYSGPSGVYDGNGKLVGSWQGPPAFYNAIYKDHSDRIYVCTMKGLLEVDLSSPSFVLKEVAGIPDDATWKNWNVSSVIVTTDNDMWIGTSQGLVHLRADQSWSVLTIHDGLLSNQVSSLFLDKSNTLWIGTDAGAASINLQTKILDNRNLPGIFSNFLLPNNDASIYVISGNTFLNQVDQHMNILRSASMHNSDNTPQSLIARQNAMLLVRQLSLEELDAQRFPFQQAGKAFPSMLYASHIDKSWFITDMGFHCSGYPGDLSMIRDTSYNATVIAQARNHRLLLGTLQDGLFLVKPEDVADGCRLQQVRDFASWTDDPRIRSLITSKNGDIWIGTRFSGVLRLQCDEDYSHCTKQTFSISDGLVSNWITSLTEDQYGNIWAGSASGIDKLIPRGDTYYVFSFSRVHGYYANVRQLVTHPDGSLWAGHSEGLSRIIDGNIDTIGPPDTYITEVVLGGDDYPTVLASPVLLRYHQNSAHFTFAAPDFIHSSQLMFTYRLLGSNDTSWSQPFRIHEIFYGNLIPGKYTFEVASFGWNGEQGNPASYAFVIKTPFWKQAWFILLAIVALTLAVVVLYQFRIAQLRRVQTVRDRIAADLHDEIASTLTHINILSLIGRQQHMETPETSNLFERIGTEAQTSAESLDDIIWSVKTKRDAIGDLIARMRQYATEIFEPIGIAFEFDEQVAGMLSLEMEFKRDLYLVYKEILRNILRHADATHVDIRIQVDRAKVSLEIEDNGRGFDIHAHTDRCGLSNIRGRVRKWGGQVTWKSAPGKGTHASVVMQPVGGHSNE